MWASMPTRHPRTASQRRRPAAPGFAALAIAARLWPVQQPFRVHPSAPARLVVLASGTGSLLASLLDAAVDDYPARVVAVGVDRDCPAVDIATAAALPTFKVRLGDYPNRAAWDDALTEATAEHSPYLV